MTQPIETGKSYWVELEHLRIKLRALEPAQGGTWWRCAAPLGTEVVVPATAFREECADYLAGPSDLP
jgi:hypothetical protein